MIKVRIKDNELCIVKDLGECTPGRSRQLQLAKKLLEENASFQPISGMIINKALSSSFEFIKEVKNEDGSIDRYYEFIG